jgi:hypothetical protein
MKELREKEEWSDQLKGFEWFLQGKHEGGPESSQSSSESFKGSLIRLPLRLPSQTFNSLLSSKSVTPDEIKTLLEDFIKEEIQESLLFLKHVKSIEIYELDSSAPSGKCLASVDISKEAARRLDGEREGIDTCEYLRARISLRTSLSQPAPAPAPAMPTSPAKDSRQKRPSKVSPPPLPSEQPRKEHISSHEYLILSTTSPAAKAASLISFRIGRDARSVLEKHKLEPRIGLALPIGGSSPVDVRLGRLFTFLPLPISTLLPVHVNALFALTQSRQNLVNRGEIGVVKGSEDRFVFRWAFDLNAYLIEIFIFTAS